MYAKITESGVLARATPAEGYKPVEESAPEERAGFRSVFHYEDIEEKIIAVFDYIELTEEEKEEIERRGIDDAEAFDIIFGGDGE